MPNPAIGANTGMPALATIIPTMPAVETYNTVACQPLFLFQLRYEQIALTSYKYINGWFARRSINIATSNAQHFCCAPMPVPIAYSL